MDIYLKECYLEKTNQFQALEVLKEIKELGTKFLFKLDVNEDGKEVSLYTQAQNPEDAKKIGVLNKNDAIDIKKFLEAGWNDNKLFLCKVCRFDEKADENKRISVAIYVKENL